MNDHLLPFRPAALALGSSSVGSLQRRRHSEALTSGRHSKLYDSYPLQILTRD